MQAIEDFVPLPLSYINNNYHHYGNPPELNAPGTEAVLVNGLMNGVRFLWGRRYRVNLLDLAIARDCGVALSSHHTFAGPGRVMVEPMVDGIARLIWPGSKGHFPVPTPLGDYAPVRAENANSRPFSIVWPVRSVALRMTKHSTKRIES